MLDYSSKSPSHDELAPRGLIQDFMDCSNSKDSQVDLLSGFDAEQQVNQSYYTNNRLTHPTNAFFSDNKGEEDEEEIIQLTHRPLLLPKFLDSPEGHDILLHSITYNTDGVSKDGDGAPIRMPGFLPQPLPATQLKSRSLFHPVSDPLQRIIQADAIAEASRFNDPLTDDESDLEGGDEFLLCMPKQKSGNDLFFRKSRYPSRNSNQGSQSSLNLSSSDGRDSTPTLTSPVAYSSTYHDQWANSTGKGLSDSTFSTHFSSDDSAGNFAYARKHPTRPSAFLKSSGLEQSACSLLSMNSLCGLDIVHETEGKVSILPSSESFGQFEQGEASFGHKFLRSEQSFNSLGLSVDSSIDASRDLFTPPMSTTARSSRQMLSPPPLKNKIFINSKT
jgi:hypothetical protein